MPASTRLLPLLAALMLAGCAADRLLSIDYYHVRFKADPSWTPQQRAAEADSWRQAIRTRASQVSTTVADTQVYGDSSLWTPFLDPASAPNSTVTRCRARNADSKSLKLTPGATFTDVRIIAVPGDLAAAAISPTEPCDVDPVRQLQSVEIVAATLTDGVPLKSGFSTYRLTVAGSTTPWERMDLGTLIATFDASTEKGAAQFVMLAIPQAANAASTFEEAIIVPRASYFGDVKVP